MNWQLWDEETPELSVLRRRIRNISIFFSDTSQLKKSKQELGKLEIFFDSVHEQIEKRITLLSDLSNHGGEVETRVRLFKMSSTNIIAINFGLKNN